MISDQTESVAARAKSIYCEQFKHKLETQHHGRFVAIEPNSGNYYLADSFGETVEAARAAHPNRISFIIRIGHAAAMHFGGMTH